MLLGFDGIPMTNGWVSAGTSHCVLSDRKFSP